METDGNSNSALKSNGSKSLKLQFADLNSPKSLQMVTAAMKLKAACFLEENYDQSRQYIKKQKHYLPTKVHLVKTMIFPVVMYGCENLTINKADCQRTDAFELWCWRRLLRVPWTARRSNQSILKESSP